jgi:hypothetical protein
MAFAFFISKSVSCSRVPSQEYRTTPARPVAESPAPGGVGQFRAADMLRGVGREEEVDWFPPFA